MLIGKVITAMPGAAAHNFGLAASPNSVPPNGKIALAAGFALFAFFTLTCRQKRVLA